MKRLLIFPIFLLILLSVGFVSANENVTDEFSLGDETAIQDSEDYILSEDIVDEPEIEPAPEITVIEAKNVKTYYKEDVKLISYLKDSNNQPISNKMVSIFINNKVYNRLTDNDGKVVLKLNLKPNTYAATISFGGDENYTASIAKAIVTVKKASLSISTKNYRTYWHSGLFFKAKVINKITKNPVKGIKVAFKVLMPNKKYKTYYATTNSKGVAKLRIKTPNPEMPRRP